MDQQTTMPDDTAKRLGELIKTVNELKAQNTSRRNVEIGSAAIAVLAILTTVFYAGGLYTRVGVLDQSVARILTELTDIRREVAQTRVDIAKTYPYPRDLKKYPP